MRRIIIGVLGLALLAGSMAGLEAQRKSKKKPAKKQVKTVKKPAPKPGGPVVLGTNQLPGEFGKFGTTYTIGKDRPLNFTLTGADYRVERLNIGKICYYPKANEKLLVLHYTVHNPNPSEFRYYYNELRFTAVDGKDVNREMIPAVAREGDTEFLMTNLKPAQKIAAYAAILVPAEGVVPKLIVMREARAAVVRYDLREKVKVLPPPYASDPAGVSVATPIKIMKGGTAQVGEWDVQLESAGLTSDPLGGRRPPRSYQYLVLNCLIKNGSPAPRRLVQTEFEARAIGGPPDNWNGLMLRPMEDTYLSVDVKPGEEQRVRFFFPYTTLSRIGAVTLKKRAADASHTVEFDVSEVR